MTSWRWIVMWRNHLSDQSYFLIYWTDWNLMWTTNWVRRQIDWEQSRAPYAHGSCLIEKSGSGPRHIDVTETILNLRNSHKMWQITVNDLLTRSRMSSTKSMLCRTCAVTPCMTLEPTERPVQRPWNFLNKQPMSFLAADFYNSNLCLEVSDAITEILLVACKKDLVR